MRIRTSLATFIAVLTFLAGAGHSATAFQQPAAKTAGIELPMELLASRPLVRIKVNGQGPFAFLVDPEVQRTVIDARLIESLKLATQRNADGTTERHVDLELGSGKPTTVAIDEGDMSRLVPELGPLARPRGVLSLAIWAGQLVTIDYTRWRVQIEPGELPEPNGNDVFALRNAPRELLVPLSIGDHTLWCHVDPLFPGDLLLPAAGVSIFPLADKPLDAGSASPRTGPLGVRQARLGVDATVGAFVFKTPLVLFGGSGDVATLGAQWLTDFSITYDVSHARARLDRRRP